MNSNVGPPYPGHGVKASPETTKITHKMTEYALEYAARGWEVIRLHRPVIVTNGSASISCTCSDTTCQNIGKHPKDKWALLKTSNETVIRRMDWADCNIGIATGINSNLYVIDVDDKKDGLENFQKWQKKNLAFETDFRVMTGGGGYHFYFRYPELTRDILGNKANILPGVDIRGEGGYVVAPPSLHESGKKYEWEI